MDRTQFEKAAAQQNAQRAAAVVMARETGAACNVVPMLAFGGVPYCTTHRVMGPCPFGGGR
jgi:hypothetical protein